MFIFYAVPFRCFTFARPTDAHVPQVPPTPTHMLDIMLSSFLRST